MYITESDVSEFLNTIKDEPVITMEVVRNALDACGFPVPPNKRTVSVCFEVHVEVQIDGTTECTLSEIESAVEDEGISTDDFQYAVDGVQHVEMTDFEIV